MDAVHYYVDQKNAHHGRAIIQGFKARARNSLNGRLEPGALHLIGGLQFGSLELMKQVLAAGEPYIFFDRAYFGGGRGTDRLRAVPSAYQKHWQERWPDDRYSALSTQHPALALRPWREAGSHVLVVPPGPAICKLFGLDAWLASSLARLKACFDGPVRVSIKGDPVPLAERLAGSWAVVTYTSNVAVEAVLAGVPCFVDAKSAAAPVSLNLDQIEDRIERPYLADNRLAWAASLAYGQFTLDEISSGYAAEIVLPHFRG